jgi:hypothetical protein
MSTRRLRAAPAYSTGFGSQHGASRPEGDAGETPEEEDREHSLQPRQKSKRRLRSSQNPFDAEFGDQESDRGNLRIAERQQQPRDATLEKVQPRGRLIDGEGKVRCEAQCAPEKTENDEAKRVSSFSHDSCAAAYDDPAAPHAS